MVQTRPRGTYTHPTSLLISPYFPVNFPLFSAYLGANGDDQGDHPRRPVAESRLPHSEPC